MTELRGNHAIESAAMSFVIAYEAAQGRTAVDTRYKGAPVIRRPERVCPAEIVLKMA